jgi:hypothetical protein
MGGVDHGRFASRAVDPIDQPSNREKGVALGVDRDVTGDVNSPAGGRAGISREPRAPRVGNRCDDATAIDPPDLRTARWLSSYGAMSMPRAAKRSRCSAVNAR